MRLLIVITSVFVFAVTALSQNAGDQLLAAERGLSKATGELG